MAWIAASAATAGISFLGVSSSPSQTLCESSSETSPGDDEPEIDPYDNLPEEDEPTHCSICLTYRQGPCRPFWRKVEACTKDGEKERKKEEEEEGGESDANKKDGDSSSSPMSESTRCFKYMMPWIDCASKYRNLYTLIEMDTNYTEGIQELEATSRHFCWMPGKEPKIDWSNWQQSETEDEVSTPKKLTDADATSDPVQNVALWKTLDPSAGDPKLITIEAKVPSTINSGLGILECAYAVDQDNNVIGFAYGTKPSDLIKEADDSDKTKTAEGGGDEKKPKNIDDDGMVALNIRLVASRTEGFTLSASYTHRIEGVKSTSEGGNNNMALESHLYKSKPFALASIPKESDDSPGGVAFRIRRKFGVKN